MQKIKKGDDLLIAKETSSYVYPVYFEWEIHLHVTEGNSKTGKGIYIVNLLPGSTPLTLKNGSQLTNVNGTCAGCSEYCENDCYAIRYTKLHHNSCVPIYAENTLLAKYDLDVFFNELQNFIDRNIVAVIRYHAAGEIPSYEYLLHMVSLAKANPQVQFYTYTKRFEYLERYIKYHSKFPDNLVINVSIWNGNYDNPYEFPEFIYDDGTNETLKNMIHCPAVDVYGHDTGETCSHCKMCLYAQPGSKVAVYAH